jgi:NADH:ubiquinone oxidoreductase subunit 3 (subunit A)
MKKTENAEKISGDTSNSSRDLIATSTMLGMNKNINDLQLYEYDCSMVEYPEKTEKISAAITLPLIVRIVFTVEIMIL